MGDFYLPLLGLLFILAFFFQDDFVFTLVYLLAGTYALTRLWRSRTSEALQIHRRFLPRAFPGETVKVEIELINESRLPIVWLQVSESLSMYLSPKNTVNEVVSLAPKSSALISYEVFPRKRGYYKLGPAFLNSGDILGLLSEERRIGQADHLIVYPEILPLGKVNVPSWSPIGSIRHRIPIFEDPARVAGKRPYSAGDSLRRVDWKASASSGALQVKILDPSIALETILFLDFSQDNYRLRERLASSELAVMVAASLANWVAERKSPVGLITNGVDSLDEDQQRCRSVPARSGRAHLMRILEMLARVQLGETQSFAEMVRQELVHLPWGATIILVASEVEPRLFDEMYAARQRGLNLMLVMCGAVTNVSEARRKARSIGVPVVYIARRSDLETWK